MSHHHNNRDVLNGSKVTKSHTTVIDAAEPVVRALRRIPCVTKIVIGPIGHCGPSRSGVRIKVDDVPAGVRVLVRGVTAVQVLFVYGADRSAVRAALVVT